MHGSEQNIRLNTWIRSPYKRIFDVCLTLIAMPLILPILLILCLLVLIYLGRPIFFIQIRPGLDGRPFKLIKLRTLNNAKGPDACLLPDEKRRTRLGCLLRTSSLDELPELFNILKGEMSLVGPRPLLMEYLPLYTEQQARRHEARPGITGLAQVNGRNNLPWPEVFEFDVWYVEHATMTLDLRIIWQTIFKMVKGKDINAGDMVGRKKFKGES